MGKSSRRNRMKDAVARSECPVCMEPLRPSNDVFAPEFFDNALKCDNGHDICTACVCKLVAPCMHTPHEACSALHFVCPICRKNACLHDTHVLVVMKHSWSTAIQARSKARAQMREAESSEGETE
jgi:hypothetical protein